MGMAFVDTLIAETDATVALVDAGPQPGGHWTSVYPFVRLHQPSAYYGVNSCALGSDRVDQAGWNEGFYELATGSEVCAYYDQVMRHNLLPTGRLSYFPMSTYLGDKRFRTLDGTEHTVNARRRVVNATYLLTVVPAMRPRPFPVADGVDAVPPNDLPRLAPGRNHYTIVGAGKTGMDACLWLIRHGVSPDCLRWITPRDSWLMNRANVQPGALFAAQLQSSLANRVQAIAAATSMDDLFERLEATGELLRIDPGVRPMMYHCAIVSLPSWSSCAASTTWCAWVMSNGWSRTNSSSSGAAFRRKRVRCMWTARQRACRAHRQCRCSTVIASRCRACVDANRCSARR
jgi:hypothetical protein